MPRSTFHLNALALSFPEATYDHPNKLPFRGILAQVNIPSAGSPQGASGHAILLPRSVAQSALGTLQNMPLNAAPSFRSHEMSNIVGTIYDATIEGNDIVVRGALFAKNAPDMVSYIKKNQQHLGLSFELSEVEIRDPQAPTWEILSCVFTGASCLLKSAAAYGSQTSIAAQKGLAVDPIIEKLNTINRSLATSQALLNRQARRSLAPPPERSTRLWHERDDQVQREQPWLSPTARAAMELRARGITPSAPAAAPLAGPAPDHRQHRINWDEQVYVGNGCTVRRGDMGHAQLSDAVSVAERQRVEGMQAGRIGNGQVYHEVPQHPMVEPVNPADADLHQAKTLEELDQEWKVAGLSVQQRMVNTLKRTRPLI